MSGDGRYPRFALFEFESPSGKRVLFETDDLNELAEFALEKNGEAGRLDDLDVPEEWFWHKPADSR